MKNKFLIFIILLLFPFYVFADEIDIYSNNAILYNLDTDEVLYEKNPDDKVLIASLTKIMTAIVSIENIENIDDKVILTKNEIGNLSFDLSKAGFNINEELTYRDLLYGTLLPSGADATHSLALFISGSEGEFANLMNKKAQELGMVNTHFENSIGIETDKNEHYSSARDVAILLKYCLKNQIFKEIFTTESYKTSDNVHILTSSKYKTEKKTNTDLSVIGGLKTGFTSKAGLCLASISSKKNPSLLLVTIGADPKVSSTGNYDDTTKIYDYFYNNYDYKDLVRKGNLITLKTEYNDKVIINQDETIKKYLKRDTNLKCEYKGLKVLKHGTYIGDKIGTYYVKLDDKVLFEKDIYSPITVKYKISVSDIKKYGIIITDFIFLLFVIIFKQKIKNKMS